MRYLIIALLFISTNLHAQTKEACSPGFIWDGKKCVSCVKPCDTGLKGACGRGLINCPSGVPVCEIMTKPGDRVELCNGEDDDCDGVTDEGFDKDKDGYATCGGDCDDRNPAIHPDAVEKCDGIDNDCNGVIDDGFDIGSACTAGRGACAQKGKRQCSPDGSGVMCTAVAGNPGVEICDGIDNDCDGMTDNGLGEITCGVGSCRQAVPACKDGKANKCNPLKPAPELCGDGADNDCDGRVDEDFETLGKHCRVGIGVCERTGTSICSEDKLSLVCNAAPGRPQAEICGNRYDDDCNGVVDDAAGLNQPCDNGQVGECRREGKTICDTRKGEVICSAAKIEPKAEKCDGLDNDCDGETDEGVKNACGTCGALPASIGERCKITGSDICGAGVWECDKDKPGSLMCAPHFDLSENLACPGDENPCTKDFCHEGVCAHSPVDDGIRCDDGNVCTLEDHCVAGICKGGGLPACDDGNSCTIDRCDPDAGCVHDPVGGGRINECGSCGLPVAVVGDSCNVTGAAGVCAKGEYRCTPEGDAACVQTVFGSNEICNGEDDDCNGAVDDGLGETSCGVGACKVTVANCANGEEQTCVSLQPKVETCQNMGVDDDCNGVVDDVAAGCGKEAAPKIGGFPFDPARTRAAMLPWFEVNDAIVTSSDPKTAWFVVSGSSADKNGLAATPVREIFGKGQILFRSCELSGAGPLKKLTMAGTDETQPWPPAAAVAPDLDPGALLPQSSIDEVVAGNETSFVHPHALTKFNGKEYGGDDLFAAFDIKAGSRKLGTMGFFYWNKNEPPSGTITGVAFDGKKGVAKLNFTDPDGDALKFSAHITAKHGGSLNHWIERVDENEIRFSAKGEAASAVGVWPIRLTVEVIDPGEAKITTTAVIAHDGTVELIQEDQ